MLQWESVKLEFREDISWSNLRDIYVFDTTINDWQLIFDKLKNLYQLEYTVDNDIIQMPDFITEIFATHEIASTHVYFDIGNKIMVGCHFFMTNQIEFDILAREINSPQAFDTLLGFLRLIGDKIQKTVTLTDENDETHPIISYRSDEKAMFYHNKPT